MCNPFWGAPRIYGELLKIGIEVSERTVSGLLRRFWPRPPSQTWRTFLDNHMHNTFSMDFLTVPTAIFKVLFVLVIIDHSRRKVVHFGVTRNPSAKWTAQQVVEACPFDATPKYLLRDRDSIYGTFFRQRIKNLGIKEVVTAHKSPWQNPFVERLIGSIRRECLNHVIVLNERHLRRILSSYFEYYHNDRTHLGLGKDTPLDRPAQPKPSKGKLVAIPKVGGLHHRYKWEEAA
jgi:putative transposase